MNGYNFTTGVRRALTAAREAAARLHHDYVSTEHILLGLIATKDQSGSMLLEALAIDVDALRLVAESAVKHGTVGGRTGPDLPYTSRAKKCLEFAMVEARERRDSYVGTGHLLAGLLREERGIAAQVLTYNGVTIEAVRPLIGEYDGESDPAPGDQSRGSRDETESETESYTYTKSYTVWHAPANAGPRLIAFRNGLLVLGLFALVASAIGAAERGTWVLEVFPIFIGVPLLILTARRFPLTPLAYGLIFVHAIILMVGGHYTYAKVPLGFWMRDAFHLTRNNYDRIGHFAQGFVPAIIAREILIRRSVVRSAGWLFFVVTCICLSISACYEFIEWATAVIGGSSADAFLGTQGDIWDTQWDMFTALIGALVAQITLSRVHDRQLRLFTGREIR
jgi:putative membrane protein